MIINPPDLSEYIKKLDDEGVKFNEEGGEAIFDKLRTLSVRLCADLDKQYPTYDVKTGQPLFESPENLCFSASLILSAWLGWLLKSKAISHHESSHAEQEVILVRRIINGIIDAYGIGIEKALKDKGLLNNKRNHK